LPTGLSDCDRSFETLWKEWSLIGSRGTSSPAQFPEVVSIWNRAFVRYTSTPENPSGKQLCSGTVIGSRLVLTAAHCFLGENYSTAKVAGAGNDFVVEGPPGITVRAGAAVTLGPEERERRVDRIIVHRDYGAAVGRFQYDLAILELDRPYPVRLVPPARLASAAQFSAATTTAGYGYSDSEGGTLGHFNITWPPLVQDSSAGTADELGMISFNPASEGNIVRGFCQGDSGGPVFALRYRGCKASDRAAEYRPHLIEGVISHYFPQSEATPRVNLGDPDCATIASCQTASKMVMQDVTAPNVHAWICRTTSDRANGC
jgi:hypothetical protein